MQRACVSVWLSAERGGVGETWLSPSWRLPSSQELSLHSLSLRLLVQAQLLQHHAIVLLGPRRAFSNLAHALAWAWRGVVWCGVVWCGVVWCGVVWCGVVWCGVVWCGVVWCGVVWCGVPKALLPNGNGQDALHTVSAKWEGCVFERVLCVVCCAPLTGQELSPRTAALGQGRPWDPLPLRVPVQLKFSQCPPHSAPLPQAGLDEALWSSGVGLVLRALCSGGLQR